MPMPVQAIVSILKMGASGGRTGLSLAMRLVAGVVAINLCAIALAGFSLLQNRNEREQSAKVTALNLARMLDHDVAGVIRRVDLGLLSVVDEVELEKRGEGVDRAVLDPYLARLRDRLPEVEGVRVCDATGAILYGTGLGKHRGNISDRDYFRFQKDRATGGLCISKPLVGRITGIWTLNLSRRINNADGSFGGVVYATIPLEHFADLFSPLAIGSHGGISLRDGGMGIIARFPRPKDPGSMIGNRVMSPELKRLLGRGEMAGTFYTPRSWDSVAKVVSYRRVGEYPLFIAVGVAERDYLAKWWDDVLQMSALVALFSLVTIALGRLQLVKWRQEQQARGALVAAKEELEARVEARTSALMTATAQLEREFAEAQRTQESLRKLSRVVEQSPLCILITDREGVIEFINPRFTQVTGYEAHEALGNRPSLLKSGETPPAVYRDLWETVLAGRIWVGELLNRKKGGELFRVRATIAPIIASDGSITHLVSMKEDITAQKLAEEARERAEEMLRQAQKMEAVGQLAGGIAHDFNNILTVIIGYCEVLRIAGECTERQLHDVGQIADAAERASKLTRSLLAFSRNERMHPEPRDINGIVTKVEALLLRVIGEDVTLRSELCEGSLVGKVDEAKIEQVLINLATNARDAMPRGGLLTIGTRRITVDRFFVQAHGYGTPGDYAQITVCDTGNGMDEATRDRIFEPFFTTKEVGKGTGLGMSIVYGIVKQHGGFINVYSEPDQGTTFRIYLPLADLPVGVAARKAEPSLTSEGAETILVVEDEPPVQGVVERLLNRFGYRVIVAGDGEEGVEKFARHRDEIGLVLMDIIMPKMNGQEACDRIRRIDPGARVLFTSGYTADIIERRGELSDGAAIIMKPVHPTELLLRIREILDAR